jgi:peptidoglycan hydrolase-like protein with peptidoglycan-binding domain
MMTKSEQDLFDRLLKDGRLIDHRWVAYIMATVKHETNNTFEPVREAYWLSEDWRRRNLRYWPWYGRGYVQITWEFNYLRADEEIERTYREIGKRVNLDLETNPELAMDPDIAYEILVQGMIEGWFTNRKLADYINRKACDYEQARRIVNGMDRAGLIAGYARDYEEQIPGPVTGELSLSEANTHLYATCSACVYEKSRHPGPSDCVELIQDALNEWNERVLLDSLPLTLDGRFGTKTKLRVEMFQRHHDLDPDGIVGPRTWEALRQYL